MIHGFPSTSVYIYTKFEGKACRKTRPATAAVDDSTKVNVFENGKY